ncbi:MAG: purine-nucleoside phosphorylase [Acidimicrobiales bacterium]
MDESGDRPLRTARELARRTGVDGHDVLVILGSGLAGAAELLGELGPSLPLATLPFFPRYTATGHHAEAWSVPMGDQVALVFAGRCHLYEGIDVAEVVHPLRTGIAAGCSTVVLTAAVGGIREDLDTGSVVVVRDQINLTGCSPLHGPQFVDMTDAYTPRLRALARDTPGIPTPAEGVYAQVRGPQFETPAEVAMLRHLGADVVGMSMAIETITARHAGADVLGLAVVTNAAAGALPDLAQVGARSAPTVAAMVRHVVGSLP